MAPQTHVRGADWTPLKDTQEAWVWGHRAQLGETSAGFLEVEMLPLLDDRFSLDGNQAPADGALPDVYLFLWHRLFRRSPSSERIAPAFGEEQSVVWQVRQRPWPTGPGETHGVRAVTSGRRQGRALPRMASELCFQTQFGGFLSLFGILMWPDSFKNLHGFAGFSPSL